MVYLQFPRRAPLAIRGYPRATSPFWLPVLLCCAIALSKHHADPDLWGHVQYGRDLLSYGLPETSTYSYTSEGYPWINHELLSELLLALGVQWIGPAGLLAVKCLIGALLIAWIIGRATGSGVSQTVAYAMGLLVAAGLMHFWSLRPQFLSYLYFVGLIAILDQAFREWSSQKVALRWLLALVPLFMLWANSHGGFVAGYCLLVMYLLGRTAEVVWQRHWHLWKPLATFGTLIALAGLATLANPYGWRLHAWLRMSLGSPRPEIIEWLPPELSMIWLPFWLMAALLVASVLFTKRPRDYTQLLLLAIVLWQATEHRRHIAFFALLFGMWMPLHLYSLWQRLQKFRKGPAVNADHNSSQRRLLPVATLLLCAPLAAVLFQQLRELPVRRDGYPVAAFQYMADRELQGNLVVRFRWAQYAIAAFGARSADDPGLRVFFDGRFRTCYPQSVIDAYFDFAMGAGKAGSRHRAPDAPPVDGARVLQSGLPDLVLIGRQQAPAVLVMQQHADQWVLLYQDELAQLWGRKDRYDRPGSPDYIPLAQRSISDAPQSGTTPWPALPRRGMTTRPGIETAIPKVALTKGERS